MDLAFFCFFVLVAKRKKKPSRIATIFNHSEKLDTVFPSTSKRGKKRIYKIKIRKKIKLFLKYKTKNLFFLRRI